MTVKHALHTEQISFMWKIALAIYVRDYIVYLRLPIKLNIASALIIRNCRTYGRGCRDKK